MKQKEMTGRMKEIKKKSEKHKGFEVIIIHRKSYTLYLCNT